MNNPKFIVLNQKEEPISIQRVEFQKQLLPTAMNKSLIKVLNENIMKKAWVLTYPPPHPHPFESTRPLVKCITGN